MAEPSLDLHLTHQSFKKILFARSLRRKMTKAEELLWDALRAKKTGCKFRRQVPLGLFVADFCCMEHRFIIEVDGGIHKETVEYDAMRDNMLSTGGFKIIRFNNQEVMTNISAVLGKIQEHRG